jgi:hypothetical protein
MFPFSFGYRTVYRAFPCGLVILSFFCFNIATFAQPADEDLYRKIMIAGQKQLEASYTTAKVADLDSTKARTHCEEKDRVSAKQLNEQSKKFADQADALAHDALGKFRLAEALKPGHPEAIFGEALALLQLKEYGSAIKKIEAVRKANYPNPETTFALGLAFVSSSDFGSTEFQAGLELLADYINEAHHSPHPDTFINLQMASNLIDGAGKKTHEQEAKQNAKNEEPNSDPCPMPIPGRTELPFKASILSGIGYNDNFIALGRGQPLPSGTAQKNSLFNESTFSLSRDFSLSHPSSLSKKTGWLADKLSLSYVFTADTFEDLPEQDRVLQTVLGSYLRALTPHVASLLKVSDQWLYIDRNISSNLFTTQQGLVLTFNTRCQTLISYYLIRTDGFAPSTPANNPDGFTHRAELAQTYVLVQDKKNNYSPVLTLTGQYGHEWTLAAGEAQRLQRDDLLGKIEWKAFRARDPNSFVRGVTIAVSDRWRPDRYTHATFSSSTTTGLFARSEDTDVADFAVSIPMWHDRYMGNAGFPDANRLEATLDYHYTTRDSNVLPKNYDQNFCLVSLKLNF